MANKTPYALVFGIMLILLISGCTQTGNIIRPADEQQNQSNQTTEEQSDTPPTSTDPCAGVVCPDSVKICPDGTEAACSNTCTNGTCSNCTPSCEGHEIVDQCADVVCSPIETNCPDGFVATCTDVCDPSTGVCSGCTPDCTGHETSPELPQEENIIINEIMYNPSQNDYYNEWVEIYNPTSNPVDLTGWTLCSKEILSGYIEEETGELKLDNGLVLGSGSYAIITDGGSGTLVYKNFEIEPSLAIHVDASAICGGLSNEGRTVFLNNTDGDLIDSVTYENSAREGFTLERKENQWSESLTENGTPGKQNSI